MQSRHWVFLIKVTFEVLGHTCWGKTQQAKIVFSCTVYTSLFSCFLFASVDLNYNTYLKSFFFSQNCFFHCSDQENFILAAIKYNKLYSFIPNYILKVFIEGLFIYRMILIKKMVNVFIKCSDFCSGYLCRLVHV